MTLGTLQIISNGVGIGNITTTNTSPITFTNIQSRLLSGLNNGFDNFNLGEMNVGNIKGVGVGLFILMIVFMSSVLVIINSFCL